VNVAQVTLQVAEADGANIIAIVAVISMAVASVLVAAFDLPAIRSSVLLLARNVRQIVAE
jgi:hypothetical protein